MHRGSVDVVQNYSVPNQATESRFSASFIQDIASAGTGGTAGCVWEARPNDCGGLTYNGTAHNHLDPVGLPFLSLCQSSEKKSAGDVTITGPRPPALLVPNEGVGWAPSGLFQAGDVVHVSAAGGDVPSFAAEAVMPPTLSFLTPDLAARAVVYADPLRVTWTPEEGPGNVEVIVSKKFTPDASGTFSVVQCVAPLAAGALILPVQPDPPIADPSRSTTLLVRVANSTHVRAGEWDIDVSATSFEATLPIVAPSTN